MQRIDASFDFEGYSARPVDEAKKRKLHHAYKQCVHPSQVTSGDRSPAHYPPGFLDTDARDVLPAGFFAGIDPVRSNSRKKTMPYRKQRPSLAAKCYREVTANLAKLVKKSHLRNCRDTRERIIEQFMVAEFRLNQLTADELAELNAVVRDALSHKKKAEDRKLQRQSAAAEKGLQSNAISADEPPAELIASCTQTDRGWAGHKIFLENVHLREENSRLHLAQQKLKEKEQAEEEQALSHPCTVIQLEQEEIEKEAELKTLSLQREKLFGDHLPVLLQRIDKCTRFHKKPRGPFGLNIKVTDQLWAGVIEHIIGHLMSTIIVHDEHDRQVLQAIYTNLGVMGNPEVHPFDESHGGPGREYRTVLDELEISDNVISNALRKMAKLDSILLFTTVVEAGQVMLNNADHKADIGYTPEGQIITDHTIFANEYGLGPVKYLENKLPARIAQVAEDLADVQQRLRNERVAFSAC